MAAKMIFPSQNNYTQKNGDSVGICTNIALRWARKTLVLGRGLRSLDELGIDAHSMNAQMTVLRTLDNDPEKQCELVQLKPVGRDHDITSSDDLIRVTKSTKPYVAIFWTRTHTMGYRYDHHEKEFFDNEVGLFRAKLTKDIKSKIDEITAPYGPIIGMRVVDKAA